jgi:hypothetical protein
VQDKEQMDLIYQHCGDLSQRIRACRSRTIAESLKEQLCREIRPACSSEMVLSVLRRFSDKLIDEVFDEKGENRFLEAK